MRWTLDCKVKQRLYKKKRGQQQISANRFVATLSMEECWEQYHPTSLSPQNGLARCCAHGWCSAMTTVGCDSCPEPCFFHFLGIFLSLEWISKCRLSINFSLMLNPV